MDLATCIFERIVSDIYPRGTRLPAERQLAAELQVSRNAIRQTLDVLQQYGVISRRSGSGSVVTYRDGRSLDSDAGLDAEISELSGKLREIPEITGPLELNVVRSIVEPELVRLAVINMSVRDMTRLKECLNGLEAVTTSAEDFTHWDLEFHLRLAQGTHNPLLIGIYELIDHVRRHAHWSRTNEKTFSPNRIRDYQAKHRSIYEAIEARDIESAVEFAKLQMTEVQRDLMRDS